MKARIIVLMLVIGFLAGSNQASAQLGGILKDKAKNALNKGLKKDEEKKKENEQTQQQQQTQQQEQQTQQNQQTQENPTNNFMQRKMMGMMGLNNVKYETNYHFSSSMTMEMQSTDSTGKKSDKVLYTTFFDKNSKSFAMEFEGKDKQSGDNQKSLMIFDYINWAMLILGEKENGQKSGIAMQMQKDSTIEAEKNNPNQETKQTKEDLSKYNTYYKATGRSKTIAGYNCKEYVYENTEGRAEIWATNDIVFDYSSAYGHMGAQTLATGGTTYGLGTTLEWHFINKNTSRSDMSVIEIKPSNPKSLDISGYQIIGMGGQKGQQQGKEKEKEKGKNKK